MRGGGKPGARGASDRTARRGREVSDLPGAADPGGAVPGGAADLPGDVPGPGRRR